ncbi:conidiation-specific protein 13 [Trichoderma asperellum]|uniref:Conidiation-specific protein 13 n=1 Tax=Trichoderma asperellum TaxID=101201 RepID=A0A6V8R8A4_TRIAP|nr:hypothetical protein LI328DRAFT_166422 [Trichoderma asperelloides]GFP60346.1 conidiation-specific protein 13 [Trichoderma asperellum]
MASKISFLFLLPLALAKLDKPIIQPNFPGGGLASLGQGLLNNLSPTQSTSDNWGAGWIPADCKSLVQGAGLSPFDVTPFNIHYTDCSQTWTFCRHKDSPLSQTDIIDLFGRVPVRMRDFIRHYVFIPGATSAGSSGDNTLMVGNVDITVFLHEIGHSLDSHAFDPSYGAPFSNSNIWISNYNLDSAVTDSYAQTSQQENFAQETVVSVYDKVVPGGIGTIQPNWQAIFHQYATLQGYIGDTIIPGGTCVNRLTDSQPVTMGNSAKLRRGLGPKPTVSLSPDVKEIKPIPMSDSITMTTFDEFGKANGTYVIHL